MKKGDHEARGTGGLAPLPPAEEELLLEEVVSESPDAGAPETDTAPTPRTAAEVHAAEAALRSAGARDSIARIALSLARRHVAAAALFVVHRGVVAGLRAEVEGRERTVDGVLVPADGESLFAAPLRDGETLRFNESRHPLDARVLRALGRESAADRMLLPIAIRGRIVNLLYVDNGPDALASSAVAALRVLAELVAGAYERLLVERKQRPA